MKHPASMLGSIIAPKREARVNPLVVVRRSRSACWCASIAGLIVSISGSCDWGVFDEGFGWSGAGQRWRRDESDADHGEARHVDVVVVLGYDCDVEREGGRRNP